MSVAQTQKASVGFTLCAVYDMSSGSSEGVTAGGGLGLTGIL